MNRELCADCGRNTVDMGEYYMVHDNIWTISTFRNPATMLCIGCLERRLGRLLRPEDFTDAPVNRGVFFDQSFYQSVRLKSRLLGDRVLG